MQFLFLETRIESALLQRLRLRCDARIAVKLCIPFNMRRYSLRDMFYNAFAFDQPLTNWNTACVEDMSNMFFGAVAFRGVGLAGWNTENVFSIVGCCKFKVNESGVKT